MQSMNIMPLNDQGHFFYYQSERSVMKKILLISLLSLLMAAVAIPSGKERGCWIKIASDKEFESIRFKVDDGVIVFPMELKGSNAVAEGVVSVRTLSVEDQIKSGKAMAKEEGTTFDESTVKGPKTVLMIKGEGAQVETK